MAFNFNWSPLIADTARAKEMLTAALNKSPKPPIIVDDILVNELNLGSSPPELEILEIGDLAEDRFRGIFKMSYAGDAYLTLKTRVQANPLNTYLSTRPSFASPQPLAAASSLTIPLQITLSDIRLSGFVILVFCRQKGITLVFRNDPLESLKVSSTFDAIPFVRNYLQKEIEAQLRVLFTDDLPAIIHRLSLRHLVPGHREAEEHDERERQARLLSPPIDPLGSGIASSDTAADDAAVLNSNDPTKIHATFSQKNMLRLAALAESQRTLALFTCPIRDTIFRAWVGGSGGPKESPGSILGALRSRPPSRAQSVVGSPTGGWGSAASETSEQAWGSARPLLTSRSSTASLYSMPGPRGRGGYNHKKRRHRTVNLRRHSHDYSDTISVSTDATGRHSAPDNVHWASASTSPIPEKCPARDEVDTPPQKSRYSLDQSRHHDLMAQKINSPHKSCRHVSGQEYPDPDETPRATRKTSDVHKAAERPPLMHTVAAQRSAAPTPPAPLHDKRPSLTRPMSITDFGSSFAGRSGNIVEQSWIAKIQADHMRATRGQQNRPATTDSARIDAEGDTFWRSGGPEQDHELELEPPPAYAM